MEQRRLERLITFTSVGSIPTPVTDASVAQRQSSCLVSERLRVQLLPLAPPVSFHLAIVV
jgi:hypothetical protein